MENESFQGSIVSTAVIEKAIIDLVTQRGFHKTCCPSEVARKLAPQNWRPLMEKIRDVSKELQKKKQIDICQKGAVISSDSWTGPIRLRLHQLTDTSKENATKAEIDRCHTDKINDVKPIKEKDTRATVTQKRGSRKRKLVQQVKQVN